MSGFYLKIIPLIIAFFVGILMKQLKLLHKEDAGVILRLVLAVTLPAKAISSLLHLRFSFDLFYLPLTAALVIFSVYGIAFAVGRKLKLEKTTFGSFLVGCMIMNTAFSLPFFSAAFGDEGFARASIFDIGNSFLIFTFIYYNAIKYGENTQGDKINWLKLLKLPPLWALHPPGRLGGSSGRQGFSDLDWQSHLSPGDGCPGTHLSAKPD